MTRRAAILADGHAIGNHGWDHPALPTLKPAAVVGQLRHTADAIAAAGAGGSSAPTRTTSPG